MNKFDRKMSRILSLVLRHEPHSIGMSLDEDGWAGIDDLIEGLRKDGKKIDREILERVVEGGAEKRFIFSEDGLMVRAIEGHSVSINVTLQEMEPPTWLFHGTSVAAMERIEGEGLLAKQRDHVHLSDNKPSAGKVAERKGKPVVLEVAAGLMFKNGFIFYRASNGVWMTSHVPPDYINKRSKMF